MSVIDCNDNCTIQLDTDQVVDIYKELSVLVNDDLDVKYKEGKISGSTFAETYARLMEAIIQGSLNAVVGLQTKETAMDRCVKQEQCDSSKATTLRNDETAIKDMEAKEEQIDSSRVKSYLLIEKDYGYIATGDLDEPIWIGTDMTNGKIDAEISKTREEDSLLNQKVSTEIVQQGLLGSQKAKVDYETSNILPEQERLTKRQIIGFDDNKFIKGFNAGMSGWALGFSSGLMGTPEDGTGFPSFITDDELSQTYTELMASTTV